MASEVARHLRNNPTIAESRLWDEVRELRRQGYQFRRQVPLAGYVVDFACFDQRLIVEVDGFQHLSGEVAARDAARDPDLTWRGFKVLRFTNTDVSEKLGGVRLEILAALGAVAKVE
jgi:very-short-patch-repair endonuclease